MTLTPVDPNSHIHIDAHMHTYTKSQGAELAAGGAALGAGTWRSRLKELLEAVPQLPELT